LGDAANVCNVRNGFFGCAGRYNYSSKARAQFAVSAEGEIALPKKQVQLLEEKLDNLQKRCETVQWVSFALR
jgi:hypothetical protein